MEKRCDVWVIQLALYPDFAFEVLDRAVFENVFLVYLHNPPRAYYFHRE